MDLQACTASAPTQKHTPLPRPFSMGKYVGFTGSTQSASSSTKTSAIRKQVHELATTQFWLPSPHQPGHTAQFHRVTGTSSSFHSQNRSVSASSPTCQGSPLSPVHFQLPSLVAPSLGTAAFLFSCQQACSWHPAFTPWMGQLSQLSA